MCCASGNCPSPASKVAFLKHNRLLYKAPARGLRRGIPSQEPRSRVHPERIQADSVGIEFMRDLRR
jgi:hypothetical protein